jgi:type VI secretion system secreted protein Hcp
MDMFLRIDGIPGEADQKGHEKWIPVMSADWGASADATPLHGGGGGAGAGRAELRPAVFTAWASVATPLLFEACVSGRHAATNAAVAVRWDFEDVRVANLGISGSEPSPTMADSFALAYARVRITTYQQDPRGGAATATARGWDLAASRPW